MKKRISVLLLCALLLSAAGTAYAAAGGADDPLISLSYVEDTFLPRLRTALRTKAEARFERQTPVQKLKTVELCRGDRLVLTGGQQAVLISGSARLTPERGTLINATAGRTSTGGDAREGNRYILSGDCTVTVTSADRAELAVSVGAEFTSAAELLSAPCPFTDVKESDWFYADVLSAYRRGFVNGMTETSYAPQEPLTAAQAVKLAACMHQQYHTGTVTLRNAGDGRAWYMSYADYALQNGLLRSQPRDYNAPISRGEFVKLFYSALPEKEYSRINAIADGAIPDVPADAAIAKEVYTFYAAGILTGYTAGNGYAEHAFGADSTITRAEVATIMNRMFDPAARKRFSME